MLWPGSLSTGHVAEGILLAQPVITPIPAETPNGLPPAGQRNVQP